MQSRLLSPADIEEVAQVFDACFSGEPYNEQWEASALRARIKRFACQDTVDSIVLEQDHRIIGFALCFSYEWCDGTYIWVEDMGILPSMQAEGKGEQLVKDLVEFCKNQGYSKMNFVAHSRVQGFWEKQGFSRTEYVQYSKHI